jgi:hypothetical protein
VLLAVWFRPSTLREPSFCAWLVNRVKHAACTAPAIDREWACISFWPAFALAFLLLCMAASAQAAWASMNARMSATFQAVVRSESFTGLGALPVFTQFNQVERETGIKAKTPGRRM